MEANEPALTVEQGVRLELVGLLVPNNRFSNDELLGALSALTAFVLYGTHSATKMPDMVGLTGAEALRLLTGTDTVVGVKPWDADVNTWIVSEQDVAPNTPIAPGDRLTLTLEAPAGPGNG